MTEHNQQRALLGKIAAYTELLVNDPRSTIFVYLAETYRKMGFFNDAREIVVNGLELHPDFGPAYVVLARIECQLDHIDASCAAFERALALDPDSLAALVGYARVKLLFHHDDEARELLLHARSLSPADPVINKMLLGLTVQPAEEEPAPVVEFVPPPANNITALASTTLADLYLAQGLTEKALDLYRQLLSRNPDNLELRRKIREIEGRTEEPSLPPEDEIDAPPTLTTTDQSDVEEQKVSESVVEEAAVLEDDSSFSAALVSDNDSELEVVVAPTIFSDVCEDVGQTEYEAADEELPMEVAAACVDSTEIIHQLNNWLNNIRLRREHV